MSRVLVFVHGAGKQPSDYYKGPLAAITSLLRTPPTSVAVYYADITMVGSPLSLAAMAAKPKKSSSHKGATKHGKTVDKGLPPPKPETPEMQKFKMAFAMQVQAELSAQPPSPHALAAMSLSPLEVVELLATLGNELTGYLFRKDVFDAIQKRMRAGLEQAAANGDEIVIVSHSLGTVVAFDALRDLASQYQVSKFFTLGSPLAKLVRLGRRTSDLGMITVEHVKEWLNLYDTTDPVANALGPAYPLPGYRLRDVFVNVADAPVPSHDYFRNAETLAAIADALR